MLWRVAEWQDNGDGLEMIVSYRAGSKYNRHDHTSVMIMSSWSVCK